MATPVSVPGTTVDVVADAPKSGPQPLPFYMFEAYLPFGKKSFRLAYPGEFGGIEPGVLLRIPPNNLRISSPIRADVSLDILGGITVAPGGMGLRRWTISGTHGVGLGPKVIKQAADGTLAMSAGYACRQALASFFETWAVENEKRRKEQKPLLRLLFAIRNGNLTEFQNEEWWIQPDGLPEESRNASRPLAWDWSMSFIAMQRFKEGLARSTGADPIMPSDITQVQENITSAEAATDSIVSGAKKSGWKAMLDKAKEVKTQLQNIKTKVSSAVYLYHSTVSEVAGYIRSCATTCQEMLLMVDRSNLWDSEARGIFNSIREVQTAIGTAKMVWEGYTGSSYLASAVSPTSSTVQYGDTLQAIAHRELGDDSRWTELAELNGLTYPYLDFSADGGRPDSRFTTATKSKVLGQGDTLKLPNVDGEVAPEDPVGTDLLEEGTPRVLIGGVDNLRAALLRRLRTQRGYLPHHPDYGSDLPRFVGRPLSVSEVLSLRAEVDRVLREDPRIITVQSIAITVEADAIFVKATATSTLGAVSLAGTVGGTTQGS